MVYFSQTLLIQNLYLRLDVRTETSEDALTNQYKSIILLSLEQPDRLALQ